jgi:hypothetical protein
LITSTTAPDNRFSAAFAFTPRAAHPTLVFEPVQCRIESSLGHLQHLFAHFLNPLRDGPSVHRPQSDGLENQQIKGSLN